MKSSFTKINDLSKKFCSIIFGKYSPLKKGERELLLLSSMLLLLILPFLIMLDNNNLIIYIKQVADISKVIHPILLSASLTMYVVFLTTKHEEIFTATTFLKENNKVIVEDKDSFAQKLNHIFISTIMVQALIMMLLLGLYIAIIMATLINTPYYIPYIVIKIINVSVAWFITFLIVYSILITANQVRNVYTVHNRNLEYLKYKINNEIVKNNKLHKDNYRRHLYNKPSKRY